MVNEKMTVFVPDELMLRLNAKFPETNWAEIVRSALIKKLENLEKLKQQCKL